MPAVTVAPERIATGQRDRDQARQDDQEWENILGTAAISGVRRAAVIESAAMARCTTRKSVHQ